MRMLFRNMQNFEYLPYNGVETDLNEFGEHTGEMHPQYGEPEIFRGNISTPSGHTTQAFYGEDIRYTHTLVMEHDVGITEHGVIRWNGHMYEVTAVRPSMNCVSIALRRMTSDEGKPFEPDPAPEPEPEPDPEPEPEPEPTDNGGDEP